MKSKIIISAIITLLITFNANAQIKVLSTGQVGIGISAPSNKLDVQSASTTTPCGIGIGRTNEEGAFGVAGVSGQYSDFAIAGDVTLRGLSNNLNLVGKNGISFGIGDEGSMRKVMTILPTGNVGIGQPTQQLDIYNGNVQINGGPDLIFKNDNPGDLIFQNSSGVEMGRIFAYGSGGVYLRSNANSIGINISGQNIGIGGYSNTTYKLYVYGDIYTTGTYKGSDSAMKKDIKPLSGSMSKLKKIKGVDYFYNTNKMFTTTFNKNGINNKDSIGNIALDAAVKNRLENERQLGFVAQDFVKTFPSLVKKDANGLLAIDYTALIPVIVEALKDQDSIITIQSTQIKDLQKLVKSSSGLKSASLSSTVNPTDSQPASLDQNFPNPFNQSTQIGYTIPETTGTANLYIYNMNGLQIKTIPIQTKGKGSVSINGSELQPGMYIYALVADGKEIDTKRMILTQ